MSTPSRNRRAPPFKEKSNDVRTQKYIESWSRSIGQERERRAECGKVRKGERGGIADHWAERKSPGVILGAVVPAGVLDCFCRLFRGEREGEEGTDGGKGGQDEAFGLQSINTLRRLRRPDDLVGVHLSPSDSFFSSSTVAARMSPPLSLSPRAHSSDLPGSASE